MALKEWPNLEVYWASSYSRPERLSWPPGTLMDWKRLVRTSVMFLTSSSVGEPVMVRKSAVVSAKRGFASSGEVMMSWGGLRQACGLEVFYHDK